MICTTVDNFVLNYREVYPSWIVWLDSGLAVFQDDGRPGVEPHSAWQRLYAYCHENGDYIKRMQIRFRSNTHELPENAEGYYFSKGVRGALFGDITHNLFFCGVYDQGKLEVTCWKVPEMLREITEERDPERAGLCLISRNTSQI